MLLHIYGGVTMAESFDQLYGNRGIDTTYEREKITYRPDLNYKKQKINELLRPEVKQSIERARRFTISNNLSDYDELIAEINQMLTDIEARNSKELIDQLKEMLAQKKYKEVATFERAYSGYNQTGDFELYSLLYYIKESAGVRREFIDGKFRTQLTGETEIELIQQAETDSIDNWELLEAKVIQGYQEMAHHEEDEDHVHPSDDDSLFMNNEELSYDALAQLEKQKRNAELLHTSLADTSYVHTNRYHMLLSIVSKLRILTYYPQSLIDKNLKDFIMGLSELGNLSAPKAHLILQFKKLKDKQESVKGKMLTIDDEKESFASEKQYMYQQLETKTIEPIKEWLYNQPEEVSGALDMFSEYMVDSMKQSRTTYENSLADMLNFYKSEADFYEQQILFLKNKEEIRRFYSILEDLEDVEQIRGEWVEEYLKANGYSV
jgi:hypothetical protein